MADDQNLNIAQCLKSVSDIGVTHIHNVCSGSVVDLPWGTTDWLGALGITAVVVVMVALVGTVSVMFFQMLREGY